MKQTEQLNEESLELHEKYHGKIAIINKVPVKNRHDLSIGYTPGVAEPSMKIFKNRDDVYRYTSKGNMVAVVSDGSSVLGLGTLNAEAALPVMEGKAILFKVFGGIDAFPICIGTNDIEEIIKTVKNISPVFGGINLEDIGAPACFEIEARLKADLDIPVFHDDQHGAALVAMAGFLNALCVVEKNIGDVKVVICGAGAAGTTITRMLVDAGVKNIMICDSRGIIYKGRKIGMNPVKDQLAEITNQRGIAGSLEDAMAGADVFIGVSVGGIVSQDMVCSMADDAIVFALANPIPEIMPEDAKSAGARIVATGRSDCLNQLNNVLGFPGVFRGALDTRASDINKQMIFAAVEALYKLTGKNLSEEHIIPDVFDPDVAPAVATAVARAAIESGVARITVDPEEVAEHTRELVRQANRKGAISNNQ